LIRFILIVGLGLLYNSHLLAAPNLDQAAADACKCLEAPYAQTTIAMEAIKQAKKSGDMARVVESQGKMMEVLKASADCFITLSKNHPEIDQSDELKKQVIEKTEQMCPNPALAN